MLKSRALFKPIVTTSPLELIAIDFLHLEKRSGGYEYILVVMDHFTCYAQAYATRNKSAKTVAQTLYSDFILWFGLPLRIHHDRGGGEDLKIPFISSKRSCVVWNTPVPPPITAREW